MKINDKIINIPPYLSTTWENISSIKMKATQIAITLNDGDTVHIPGLDQETIDLIFKTHAEYIENSYLQKSSIEAEKKQLFSLHQTMFGDPRLSESPVKFGFASLDGLNTITEHNPNEKNAPDLPNVVLERIGSIAKVMAPDELNLLPKDVEDCNCFHCQITRVVRHKLEKELKEVQVEIEEEEIVSDLELQFNQWEVIPKADNLFTVTNKLDRHEQYSVFLGSPVCCNCGNANCEHIIAALRT